MGLYFRFCDGIDFEALIRGVFVAETFEFSFFPLVLPTKSFRHREIFDFSESLKFQQIFLSKITFSAKPSRF